MTFLADIDPDNPLTPMQAASCTYRIALGPRAGQKVLSLRNVPGREEKAAAGLCADAHGFSLHAGVRCGEQQRKELERLCRYITRRAIAFERFKRDGAGDVALQLKSAWRDGTTHIRLSPLEFMQRVGRAGAAPAPAPDPFLAGCSRPMPGCVPRSCRARRGMPALPADEHTRGAPARMGWARLLGRVFDIDLEHCPQRGGEFQIIPAIGEPAVMVRILTHLGLPARARRAHRRGRWPASRRPTSRQERRCTAWLAIRRGLRSHAAGKLRRREAVRADSEIERSSRAGNCCQTPRD